MEGLLLFAGCMLAAVATIGRLWCTLYIGGYKTTQLITGGPYSLCRNPLYFSSGVGLIGVGLSTGTLTVPLLLALVYAMINLTVIRSEESFLGELHGKAYQAYMVSVPRFWPRLSGLQEPAEYLVVPAKFRQAMGDALWFLGMIGIIGLAGALRGAGILPTLMRSY